jgi:galactose-1-phosphate uridylyltransferase
MGGPAGGGPIAPPPDQPGAKQESVLLFDYLKLELEQKIRIVVQNHDWVALLP